MTNKRIDYIDSCKAIGILLVILGHTPDIPEWLYTIIYSFHMPLFFILSGMLFNTSKASSKFGTFVFDKFKKYVLPYFGYAFINLALQVIYNFVLKNQLLGSEYILRNLRGIVFCYANTQNMPNCSPLWFLICLFFANIIFGLISKYLGKHTYIAVIFCSLISYSLDFFVDYKLPWNISTALMAVLFMYIGHIITKYDLIAKSKPIVLYLLLLFGVIFALLNPKNVNMNENEYGNLFFFFFASVSLSWILICICSKFSFLKNSFLLWLGKNTIFIIAFNYFIKDLTTEVYYMTPILRNYALNGFMGFVITTIGCLIGILCWNAIKKLTAVLLSRKRSLA